MGGRGEVFRDSIRRCSATCVTANEGARAKIGKNKATRPTRGVLFMNKTGMKIYLQHNVLTSSTLLAFLFS